MKDYLSGENLNKHLNTKFMGRNVVFVEKVDSTNNYAKNNDLSNGSLVTCEEQTTGRGRLGRRWESQKGMCMSVVLIPEIELSQISKITQVCAAAVAKALDELEIISQIKWPNDIFLNGKKICGILTEMKTEMNKNPYVVVGIGMNINNDNFPDEIKDVASSLYMETGIIFEKSLVAAKILNNFEILYNEFIKGNFKESLDICREKSYVIGKNINLIENNLVRKATAVDISSEGELVVITEDGTTEKIISGEVSVRLNT
ncbi:MAG: biotin--[acetyl-CoA-carboxylase] ligase [Sedimentibacter saalensis]|uniref:biotin--[acetyl-CoA-carboxylase] ligase n=1 Tax=Sedimentibacter saalensis TaxID=130788 RepID=UPI002B21A7CB|nr:biotin--[acetyl-CoA-carboxylase] ligase [Sedimentibacter saalensis]MEA5094080.1 biotin--[acetyl-CoA-carboxylase] ligase [Sedimentibacter saalensis]